MKTIKQKHYSTLEICTDENDIVEIWMNEKEESNVIQIERKNLQMLIDILKKEENKCRRTTKKSLPT